MKMTAGVSLRAKLAMVLHQRHANKKQHTFDDLVWNGQWAMVMGYMVNGVVMVMGFMVLNEILFALSRSVIFFFHLFGHVYTGNGWRD